MPKPSRRHSGCKTCSLAHGRCNGKRQPADNHPMKVLNLQCAHQHVFEGWFASEDDYVSQLGRGLVACPMCGDTSISKMLSAPRLNLGSARAEIPAKQEVQEVVS